MSQNNFYYTDIRHILIPGRLQKLFLLKGGLCTKKDWELLYQYSTSINIQYVATSKSGIIDGM